MTKRGILYAACLAAGLLAPVVVIAQAPPSVPSLPDSERRTSYAFTLQTSAAVNFALYGDSTDYQNWVEVYLNGVAVPYSSATSGWTITSPTGPVATIPRPITDGVFAFNQPQSGTVQIVGARRPRRTSQFGENRGVAARDLNQALTDIIAMLREDWDKINDVTGRGIFTQPGNTMGPLPLPAACKGAFLSFDSTGLNPQCISAAPGSGTVVGPGTSTVNDIPAFGSTTGQLLADTGISLGSQPANEFLATPYSASGVPSFRLISGADLPAPSNSTLGGVEAIASAAHQWIAYIDTLGIPHQSQPAITDLQAIANSTAVGNVSGAAAAPAALTSSQLATIVAPFTSTKQGATPASGGGTANFLRADGSWAAPSNGMVLLNTLTASNSTNLSDTSSLTAAYSSYMLVLENIIPVSGSTSIELLLQVAGTFQSSGYLAQSQGWTYNTTNFINAQTTYIPIGSSASTATSGPGTSATIFIYNPSGSNIIQVLGHWIQSVSGSSFTLGQLGGYYNTSGAATGVKFQISSGNISSGVLKIYGIP